MDKKLTKILNPTLFFKYLNNSLESEIVKFLEILSSLTDVIIFSGVIRNFIINPKHKIRDLDIVLHDNIEEVEQLLKVFSYKKNSFGGYKLLINNLKIDIWFLEDTWALKNKKVNRLLFKSYDLPNTAFFNFSSVIFNYNNKSFISNQNFINFITKKEIDLVLEENPYPELCIVNTLYYKQKYHLKVSKNLKKYYTENFPKLSENCFNKVQEKHFEEIKFSYPYLKIYNKIFRKELKIS